MSINKFFFIGIMISGLWHSSFCQSTNQDKVNALNSYVNFTNESTHGLLIVHRLLENFNKNINKYVDLPDQQINFYSNKDLPENIFEDPENWFYETSPNEWYQKIATASGSLPSATQTKLKASADEMKIIIDKVNQLRFDLEQQIKSLDLTKRENLSLVYDKLEEGVLLYKNFYIKQQELEGNLFAYYKSLNVSPADIQFPHELSLMDDVYKSN
ncbi:MAG: hypothetical protein WBO36_07610, partial [Saprospiraceae bacterium]